MSTATILTTGVATPSFTHAASAPTTTPIKHLVIIFQENASFDHYFATYPLARNDLIGTTNPVTGNPHGGTMFTPLPNTPTANGLTDGTTVAPENHDVGLHQFNANFAVNPVTTGPNSGADPNLGTTDANGNTPANPFLMFHDQAVTCDFNHDYNGEQQVAHGGLLDQFPQHNQPSGAGQGCATDGSTVMGYFDGNTVTALWNYAQRFAMSDNNWGTTYGPSTPGALNLVAGQTAGAVLHQFTQGTTPGSVVDTLISTTIPDVFFVGQNNGTVTASVGGTSVVVNGTVTSSTGSTTMTGVKTGTLVTDLDPYLDDCGKDAGGTFNGVVPNKPTQLVFTVEMQGRNVGDLMHAGAAPNRIPVTWGWFGGGFRTSASAGQIDLTHPLAGVSMTTPDDPFGQPTFGGGDSLGQSSGQNFTAGFVPATCKAAHLLHPDSVIPATQTTGASTIQFDTIVATTSTRTDYNPHHSPFQYYKSTRNTHHLPPVSVAEIGNDGQANHQYDLLDFFIALKANNLPAVSYIKGQNWQDGHPGGESDPLSEQRFLVQVINALQRSPEWNSTAVFIAWDDSDGWYDHTLPPVVNPSNAGPGFDVLNPGNPGAATPIGPSCGSPKPTAIQGRCGFGPRLVLNELSPWSKVNYVDHTLTDQASLLRFIQDNWGLDYIDGPAKIDPTNGRREPNFPNPPTPESQSFDLVTGSFLNMFDFKGGPHTAKFFLNPTTGAPVQAN